MEWLLRLLFRKRRLNDLIAESSSCSCHDGVRLIYRTFYSPQEDSEPLTETLINLFLVRDLLFKSNYCCTSELMKLWCDFQAKKQKSVSEIQEAARKLLVGHASSSAQFYLFVDILWGKFGISLLPLYLEMYIRGLTSDLNFLEAARQADNKEYVIEIENHMAAMYFKLFSLFNAINKEVALECLLSSFSLDPTKERLEWIKKLSLQISKDKAIKASSKDDGKHKPCTRNNCSHPITVKRKAVVMCDQAIQVGDDSFADFGQDSIDVQDVKSQENRDSSGACCTVENEEGLERSSASENRKDCVGEEVASMEVEEDSVVNKTKDGLDSEKVVPIDVSDVDSTDKKLTDPPELKENSVESGDNDAVMNHIVSDISKSSTKEIVVENLTNHNDVKSTSSSGHNHITEEFVKNSRTEVTSSAEKLESIAKINHFSTPIVNHAVTENHLSDIVVDIEKIKKDNNENNSVCNSKSGDLDENPDVLPKVADRQNCGNQPNHAVKESSSNCLNGHGEELDAINHDNNLKKDVNTSKEKFNAEVIDNENNKVEQISSELSANIDDKVEVPAEMQQENESCELSLPSPIHPSPVLNEIKPNHDEISHVMTRRSSTFKCDSLKFSHIVLDSKLPGVSSELLSDFVTVLESLRNKQLKSSLKWSQIKHLCEDYLENVTNLRCMMLNNQLNGSMDSEADSASEVTEDAFKEFDFQQSNSSVIEDRYNEKSHVFRRFMNADRKADMATYVTLSDIHCPQIPLEKLFYTDRSSSHGGHKKRHRRHRNHEKNPGKLVLKKLRHGSRAQREVIKHKKKKKRKAKRGKGHTKKHHFAHGKITKKYVKNKKKKHKLKKKKDGNSGFISGDYCSDFSSGELMRLVKEHSNSYSKMPASTSKHPHSTALVVANASSSDVSDEPQRKRRKVSFNKKRGRNEKCRDKHKHVKSKSSKRKKTIVVESCKTGVKNVIEGSPISGNLDSVNDYSRIVQYSSVKKMEAVQIRQRSVALNLSKVKSKTETKRPSVNPCQTNPQLQQFVQQNFESYTPEDIMKMQLLMSRQQPDVPTMSSAVSSSNQAVLKYVCSKTTSRLLSVAQTANCSDSEASKSPVPTFSARTSNIQKLPSVLHQPQNLPPGVKHFIIETNSNPYKISSSTSAVAGSALIPVGLAGTSYPDVQNFSGTVLSSNVSYPSTASSPQLTTFTIPVAHNQLGGKIVGNKIVIPLPSCGHMRNNTPTSSMSLVPAESSNFVSMPGNQPPSNVIIVKNGNNTQIIQSAQQPRMVRPYLASSKVIPIAKGKSIHPVITKTVPRIIKQAAKKLVQPVAKRTLIKTPMLCKPVPEGPTDLAVAKQVTSLSSASKLPVMTAEVPKVESSDKIEPPPTPESLLVQRAIAEAKRAIAESAPERPIDLKRTPTPKKDMKEIQENTLQIPPMEQPVALSTSETEEQSIPIVSNVQEESSALESDIESPSLDSSISPKPETTKESNDLPKGVLKLEKTDMSDETMEEAPDAPQSEDASDLPVVEPSVVEPIAENEKITSPSPVPADEEKMDVDAVVAPRSVESTSENSDAAALRGDGVETAKEENILSPPVKESEVPENPPAEPKASTNSTKAVSPVTDKELQPISDGSTSSDIKDPSKAASLNKAESGPPASEVPTRSFTSISDAVRFSLMDMDDATDSVENQVLQAFQVSHDSSPESPAYDNNSTNEGDGSVASTSSAVILTTPQATSTTELNVSRVSQRFQSTVHGSQSEKFTECQSTVSRTTTWILEDSSLNDASQAIGVQKSPEMDSSGEGKDDDKPKKKRKKKHRNERDLEAAHKFWCEICHKGFFSAYNLRRHCRNVHKMNLPKGSSELPFGPKSTSDIGFANNSQIHQHIQQGESSSSEVVTPPRLTYVQQSCVSPKGAEFMLQSPTHENKAQEFSMKIPTSQHSQMQSSDFQMQTPPRLSNQASSAHVSPVTPPKDFRLPTSTTASSVQLSPNKMSSASKTPTSPKFQRLPTSCSTPTVPQLTKISQISLCGQPTLQQQRQLGQLQPAALIQPLQNAAACQAQQLQQAAQCPHFQANKQIVQQRLGQLQLMHHAGQMPQVQHPSHGIPKQTQVQQFKKCSASQQTSKMTETEQIQQAAQLAQTQQILANQHLQKLMHIRQNAIAASGAASQLSLGATVAGIQESTPKSTAQCFQSQLAAARQAAAVTQLSTPQRTQGTSYTLTSHDATGHQFFPPSVQPSQQQTSCPHAFTTQNVVEFSSTGPSYPTIRLSNETNDGLEDLEQFLLENMPWSGEQSVPHGLAQQSGNRPASADSLTLTIPPQVPVSSQSRVGSQLKNKTSISRPKARKPIITPCSKNLLGNLGRGVKKKSYPKKVTKSTDSDCMVPKPDVFPQANLVGQQTHSIDLMQRQCNKGTSSDVYPSKPTTKCNAVSSVNETDSSDSVQCINVTHNQSSKSVSVGINFNTFAPAEKSVSTLCGSDQNSSGLMFGLQSKNSFLDQCNLVSKNCSNLVEKTSSSGNLCDTPALHAGSPFALPASEPMCDTKTAFCRSSGSLLFPKPPEISPDVFLGQRNNELGEQRNSFYGNQDPVGVNCSQKFNSCSGNNPGDVNLNNECRKDSSGCDMQSNLFLGGKTASINTSAVSDKSDSAEGLKPHKTFNSDGDSNVVSTNSSAIETNVCTETAASTEIDNVKSSEIKDVSIGKETGCFVIESANQDVTGDATYNVGEQCALDGKNSSDEQVDTISEFLTKAESVKCRDINFNDVPQSKEDSISNLKLEMPNFNNESKKEKDVLCEEDATKDEFLVPLATNKKMGDVGACKNFLSSSIVRKGGDTEVEKDVLDPFTQTIFSKNPAIEVTPNSDKESFVSNCDGQDKQSSQENTVPNGMNHVSEVSHRADGEEPESKRISLRIHKSQDVPNNANQKDANIQYYVTGKLLEDSKVTKKKSHKKKNGRKCEVSENGGRNTPPVKLDINSNIQNTAVVALDVGIQDQLDNIVKKNAVNGTVCMVPPCHEKGEAGNPEESEENEVCATKQPEEIPPGRLRLRDTPKTSVKRVCPCCVDSRVPKKCRANGNSSIVKVLGAKVQNSGKNKTTLKLKNTQSAKVNTRSSQRLRSRNNAIS